MSLTFLFSFIITAAVMPLFIKWMHKKQFGQEILEIGPSWHKEKSGTPTMGGLVFLTATVLSMVVSHWWLGSFSPEIFILVITLIMFGLLGFVDDFLKIFKKQNEGLTAKQKFLAQLGMALVIVLLIKGFGVNAYLPLPFHLGTSHFILLLVFSVIWLTGFSNAFNLTDGIDGLSSGCAILTLTGYLILFLRQGNVEVSLFIVGLIGSLFVFLIFNMKKAKVFMGDAGALAVGALMAVLSIMSGNPWSLLLFGLIYVLETASVMLQVAYFKRTHKRIFKMTPIHHHFEMSGWSEWKIDFVFWGITGVLMIVGLIAF